MATLTPHNRADEAVSDATHEGFFNGLLTLIPTAAVMALALRNYPAFAKRTNWQSRTAMTIMPAFFVAALTSEQKLSHKMREIASETQHSTETVKWAEKQWREQQQHQQQSQTEQQQQQTQNMQQHKVAETQHLSALYQQSVAATGVCIVPDLHWYHKAANFTSQNPIKILAAVAVPTVGYIFYGRTDQTHLQLSSKIMHTRVFGQFATISLLLGIMGFKEFMDHNGRFISQQQADDRVYEMQMVRELMLQKLEEERQHAADLKQALVEAHEEDVKDHNTISSKKKIKKMKPKEAMDHNDEEIGLTTDAMATSVTKK